MPTGPAVIDHQLFRDGACRFGAVILFQGDSPAAAEAFAKADPYVRNGLVTAWRVRPWKTVVGEGAASPLRPGASS